MTQIIIRISKMQERIFYWIVITILLFFLIINNFYDFNNKELLLTNKTIINNSNNSLFKNVNNQTDNNKINNSINELNNSNNYLEGTCFDGVKNQDETAVDCGGICSDIVGSYFYDNSCHKVPKENLSGEIDLTISNLELKKSPTSDAVKLTSLTLTINNGLSKDIKDYYILIYAKSLLGNYLNQFGDVQKRSYGYIDLPLIKTGKSLKKKFLLTTTYLGSQKNYEMGSDFKLVLELYDNNDNLVLRRTKKIKVSDYII